MRKIITLILILSLLMTFLTACGKKEAEAETEQIGSTPSSETAPIMTEDIQQIQAAEGFDGGDGSKSSPYRIATADQLAYLQKVLSEDYEKDSLQPRFSEAYYVLTEDIQLNDIADYEQWSNNGPNYSWTPIGHGGRAFNGVFDGGGHKIIGMYMKLDCSDMEYAEKNFGLFSQVSGTVRNVTLEKAFLCIAGDSKNVGGIAGSLMGKAVIENCTAEVIAEVYGEGNIGGIVGTGAETAILSGCMSEGGLNQSDDAFGEMGGIVGSFATVVGCENRMVLSCPKGDVGGIVGYGKVVENCINRGNILRADTAGGIAGKLYMAGTGVELIRKEGGVVGCINDSEIHGESYAGGIVGVLENDEADYAMSLAYCTNMGTVFSNQQAAGVLGKLSVARGDVYVTDCVNHGDITTMNYGGGILGYSSSAVGERSISEESEICFLNCSNKGSVTGYSSNAFLGGICGNLSAEGVQVVLENCENSGDVTLELVLTEEEINATLSEETFTLSQILGGIVGRVGEGLLLSTDNDKGREENVNREGAPIVLRNCRNTGTLWTQDYSHHVNERGESVWVSFMGGIVGNTCAEDAYAFYVEDCTYTGADRGLGNTEYPDVGTKD
ncbi:MAG: hypothetical protein IKM59_00735 [Oscillospiraceae bacterium]|nr:hypothetical protein [Oscillospiraceae bacterium]